jgi:hypothetical protein
MKHVVVLLRVIHRIDHNIDRMGLYIVCTTWRKSCRWRRKIFFCVHKENFRTYILPLFLRYLWSTYIHYLWSPFGDVGLKPSSAQPILQLALTNDFPEQGTRRRVSWAHLPELSLHKVVTKL